MGRSAIARLALTAAIVAGVSYLAADYMTLSPLVSLAWKGAGVGLLAVYAALSARNLDGWLIFGVMAFGAAGDVLLGPAGFVVGGAAFFVGHLIAIVLYQRNQRLRLGWTVRLCGGALMVGTIAAAYLLPADRAGALAVAVYATGLSYMTVSAWMSRFPPVVGLGALMFLVSDLLIFARGGPLAGSGAWLGFSIWDLYFVGQTLICVGVVRALGRDRA